MIKKLLILFFLISCSRAEDNRSLKTSELALEEDVLLTLSYTFDDKEKAQLDTI